MIVAVVVRLLGRYKSINYCFDVGRPAVTPSQRRYDVADF